MDWPTYVVRKPTFQPSKFEQGSRMPPKASKGAAKQSKLTTTGSFLPTLQKPNSVIGEVGLVGDA